MQKALAHSGTKAFCIVTMCIGLCNGIFPQVRCHGLLPLCMHKSR
jgi:hypothetical protein